LRPEVSTYHYPVFPGLFGGIHGIVGSFCHAGLSVVVPHFGNPGAESNQHLIVGVQEKALGQLALQSHDCFLGVVNRSVREQNNELFAAEAGDSILWA
jgi:hypothetical protein